MKQSKEIIAFYRELDSWIKDGCPVHAVFRSTAGLCCNLDDWATNDYWEMLSEEIIEQFDCANLDSSYPFGGDDYLTRMQAGTMYECPKRLAWIEDRLRDASAADADTQENEK